MFKYQNGKQIQEIIIFLQLKIFIYLYFINIYSIKNYPQTIYIYIYTIVLSF